MSVSIPPLLLSCLFVLTAFLDVVPPVDTLAQLVVPCFSWPILLVVGIVWIASGKGLGGRRQILGDGNDSKAAICLVLANVCSAAANHEEGTIWPYVLSANFRKLLTPRFFCQC